MPHIRKLINLSTQLNRQGRGWRNSCSSKGYFSCSPTGLLVPASTKASKTDLQVYVELIVKACPSSPPDVQASKRDAFLLFILWNIFARRTVGMTRIWRREVTKESCVTRSHVTLAIAIAVSLGIVRPDAPPTREIPLSKSDIVIAADDHGAIDHPREEEKAPSVPSD